MAAMLVLGLFLVLGLVEGQRVDIVNDREVSNGQFLWPIDGNNETSRVGIVNGLPAAEGQFPWQASVQVYVPSLDGWAHVCGGSLISENRVLTAAHCYLPEYSNYRVVLGSLTLNPLESQAQIISVQKFIRHPKYNSEQVASPNDVAVLKLVSKADTSVPEVGIIELALADDSFTGEECTISGWGRTAGDEPASNNLLYVGMNQISNFECIEFWGSLNVKGSMICVYEPPKSSCSGDSGGPMICSGKLAGVTSWGEVGCPGTTPSVYTRVSSFIKWIVKK